MMRRPALLRITLLIMSLTGLLGLGQISNVLAATIDYKSIGPDAATLFDAPTLRGRKLAIAPRGMPVEVVLMQGDWARIRDASGELSWVERKNVVDKRMVVATALATVRDTAAETAPPVFKAQKGVLLELLSGPDAGWVKVRHRDGASGFVKASEIWGE